MCQTVWEDTHDEKNAHWNGGLKTVMWLGIYFRTTSGHLVGRTVQWSAVEVVGNLWILIVYSWISSSTSEFIIHCLMACSCLQAQPHQPLVREKVIFSGTDHFLLYSDQMLKLVCQHTHMCSEYTRCFVAFVLYRHRGSLLLRYCMCVFLL